MSRWLLLGVILIAIGLGLSDLLKISKPGGQVEIAETRPATEVVPSAVPVPVQEIRDPAAQIRSTRPLEIAKLFLEEHRKEWKLQPHHQFIPQESVNPTGARVRFGVYQEGLPVLGMGIELMVKSNGEVQELSNDYLPLNKWVGDEKEFVSLDTISAALRDKYELDPSVAAGRALVPVPASDNVEPVFVLSGKRVGSKISQTILVRATDGQILGKSTPRKEF